MLRQGNCVKRFDAVSTDKLLADTGESFLIRGLYVKPAANNDYLVLKVDRKTVGVYRIAGRAGNHLDRMRENYIYKNLMEFLASKDINCSIPVAEGQSFSVASAGTSPVVVIVYDTYDAGDIRADMPNGTASKEYMFIQYMDTSETIDDTETVVLDTSLSPAEFPDFPCSRAVPANTEIEILGLAGIPCGNGMSTSDVIGSSFVKMIKEREVLFDEDRNGIPFFFSPEGGTQYVYQSDYSLIGGCISEGIHDMKHTLGDPLIFEPALKFVSGEELLVYMSFVQEGSRSLDAGVLDLAAIMRVILS